jgi:hypothetical protein
MQLLLSSATLPSGSLTELRKGMERRDFAGLEVVAGAGHDHGIEAPNGVGSANYAPREIEEKDPPIRWLFPKRASSVAEVLYWGRRAHLLRAGLALPSVVSSSPVGIPVALVHRTDPASARRASTWARMHQAHTCWEIELGRVGTGMISEVLGITAPHLVHVRLLGGGPESQSERPGGAGSGDVFKELALQGFSGTVALAPSTEGPTEKWRRWLFEKQGWGCNTAAKKKEMSSRPG